MENVTRSRKGVKENSRLLNSVIIYVADIFLPDHKILILDYLSVKSCHFPIML